MELRGIQAGIFEPNLGEAVESIRSGTLDLMLMKPVGTPATITLNFYSDDVLLLSVNTEFASTMD